MLDDLARAATPVLFFTGKGGVGKTSVACGVAVALAAEGRRVLLVSTDPASNLDEVLGTPLGTEPNPIAEVPGLFAMNLDPVAAAAAYRERAVGPHRGALPDATIRAMEEQLSGACTVEVAAFDLFSQLLGSPERTSGFDHVVFDTAPTGHTLRLLSLPAAWDGYLRSGVEGASCLGPLAGLEAQRRIYDAALAALREPTRTTVVLVARPETSALREAERAGAELSRLGLTSQRLVLNGVFGEERADDEWARAMCRRAREATAEMPPALRALPRTTVPLLDEDVVGLRALRRLAGLDSERLPEGVRSPHSAEPLPPFRALVNDLASAGHGVILAVGKGGVGKTTVAAAIAVELARRGHHVHLSTTDPAAHVAGAVGEVPAGLVVTRIDPTAETAAYTAEVLAASGAGLDAEGLALLEEDLRSPCTEEVAVFRAFARAVEAGRDGFVVLDTAPTGHTLLLLDAAQAYHREVARTMTGVPDAVLRLLPRLRDPAFTRVVVVTLPEPTPVHEASALQDDLRRAGIEPYAWVVNQTLGEVRSRHPILAARRSAQARWIRDARTRSARVFGIPWTAESPSGTAALGRLLGPVGPSTSGKRQREQLAPAAAPGIKTRPLAAGREKER